MKRCLPLALALSLALPALAQEAPIQHAPKIVCDEPSYNFGEMENMKDVEHTYVLRNEGDTTLVIDQVRPSCGCTIASLAEKEVRPGEKTEVAVKLSLHGRMGPQNKTITVTSNDPKTPTLTLYLTGTATSELEMQPNQLFYGRITSDRAVTGTIDITFRGTNEIHVTNATTDSTNLSATAETAPDGKSCRIYVATVPPLPRGTLRANAIIATDNPKYPTLTAAASAFVVDDFTYAPETITLVEPVGQPTARVIILRSETATPFKVLSVEPPRADIRSTVSAIDNASYRIELQNIVVDRGLNGLALHIKTDLPGHEDVSIPVSVVSQEPAPPAPVQPPMAPPATAPAQVPPAS